MAQKLMFAAATCAFLTSGCPNDKYALMRPGKIHAYNDPTTHRWLVTGEFYYDHPKVGEPAIISDGYGGACLLIEQNKLCSTATDCDRPPGGAAYCLDKSNYLKGTPYGQCWVHPAPFNKYCSRARVEFPGPMKIGDMGIAPLGSATVLGPAKVRLYTCLNPPLSTWSSDDKGNPVSPCSQQAWNALHTEGDPVILGAN